MMSAARTGTLQEVPVSRRLVPLASTDEAWGEHLLGRRRSAHLRQHVRQLPERPLRLILQRFQPFSLFVVEFGYRCHESSSMWKCLGEVGYGPICRKKRGVTEKQDSELMRAAGRAEGQSRRSTKSVRLRIRDAPPTVGHRLRKASEVRRLHLLDLKATLHK